MQVVLDIEANGLLDTVSKLHCLSYSYKGNRKTDTTYEDMINTLSRADTIIGHNIVCYDLPVIRKVLGIQPTARLIDTLALSWYLFPERLQHGLESWGEDLGIPKPPIEDWENLSVEDYVHRCESDVEINVRLWNKIKQKLLDLYETKEEADRLIDYLTFKMDCLREQEESKWKADLPKIESMIEELTERQSEKLSQLIEVMPKVQIKVSKTRPDKPFKKDGTLSVAGAKWFNLLREHNLPEDYSNSVEVVVREDQPNPDSHPQVKSWLTSLGWEPREFKFVKDNEGNERSIPQVRVEGELSESVRDLIEDHPEVEILDGLTVIQHRLGIFKAFKSFEKNGWLVASAGGLTNTLRLKHRNPLVNLPGVGKPYGEDIRGSLVADDGYVLCGSDMVSLEDTTKRHYMYPYDPDYVEEMSKPGFDPHLNLAMFAKVVTQQEIDHYNAGVPEFVKKLKPIRKSYKTTNYSAIYGVGPPKLARELKSSVAFATQLLEAYWERNWSVKQVIADTKIKTLYGEEMWLYNPVSRFYYSLRFKKDIFSTLNQSTGVYCFDTWMKYFRKKSPQLTAQFHDEVVLSIKKGSEEKCRQLLRQAIDDTNNELKLNIKLDIDIQFGKDYSEIH